MKKTKTALGKDPFPEEVSRNDLPVTDPQGSYTGRPTDPYETPVQDADDL